MHAQGTRAFPRAPRQCHGVTKQNKRCSITVDSKLVTDRGKLAAEPLRRGGRYCPFHSQLFGTRPASIPGEVKIFYLDLCTPPGRLGDGCRMRGGGGKGARTNVWGYHIWSRHP